MGFWCILSFGFSCSAVLHAGDGPLEVSYNPCDKLTVKLIFFNRPDEYNYYKVITQFSDAPISSGVLEDDIKRFSLTLQNSDNVVLETLLERRGGKDKLFQKLIKLTESKNLLRPCMKIFRKITVDWRRTDRTDVETFTAFGMQSAPRIVFFEDRDVLKSIFSFTNLPRHDSFYANISLKTGSSVIRLEENELRLNRDMNGSNLTLQMYFMNQDYNKTDNLTVIRLIYDRHRRHDSPCLRKPCEIVLDWENQYLSDIGPSVAAVRAPPPPLPWPPAFPEPRVTPQTLADDGNPFTVFTCHSKGRRRDLLSWYQIKGKKSSQLIMKQFSRDSGTTEMSLVLNKTLTTSDQDSWIYCIRRKGIDSDPIFSEKIHLKYSRDLPNENFYITVEPALEVATFYVNTTQSFECGGSQPVDGRSFNWYIEDVPSSNNFSHAPAETMGSNLNTRNVNLTLDLDESYHLKRIYCVQEYHMTLEKSIGYYYWKYGEKARSNEILLSMVSVDHLTDPDNMKNGSNKLIPPFVIYIVVGVALAILATVTSLVILHRYRRSINRSQDNNNESIYATAEITYAELQLSPESNNTVRREEPTPYAEIIGSCRPKA